MYPAVCGVYRGDSIWDQAGRVDCGATGISVNSDV